MEEMLSESKELRLRLHLDILVNVLTFPTLSSPLHLLSPGHLEPPELLLQAGHVLSPGQGNQEGTQLHIEVVGGMVLPARAGGGW